MTLKRLGLDCDQDSSFICYQENGEYVLYSDIAPLIEAAKEVVFQGHGATCSQLLTKDIRTCNCGFVELKEALEKIDNG